LALTGKAGGAFWIGGGVNAGSICTTPPIVFFENEVVSIVAIITNLQSARNRPNADLGGPGGAQCPGAGGGGGPG